MHSTRKLLVAALAVAGLAATADVQAQAKHSGAYRGHWSGGHHSYWGPRFGVYIGAPVLFGSYYWGHPYYGYYPGSTVVYREVERLPVTEGGEPITTTEVPRSEGAPTQGPLYMNYCASAKAYFPKVTQCPEGWKFIAPGQ